jgi:hypothetical protein
MLTFRQFTELAMAVLCLGDFRPVAQLMQFVAVIWGVTSCGVLENVSTFQVNLLTPLSV